MKRLIPYFMFGLLLCVGVTFANTGEVADGIYTGSLVTTGSTGSQIATTTSTSATGSTQTTSTSTQSDDVYVILQNHLETQKKNVDELIKEQQTLLENSQSQTMDRLGNNQGYSLLRCMDIKDISDLDRSIPVATIKEAVVNDYIALSTKIHELKVKHTLQLDASVSQSSKDSAVESLHLQIANFGENYKKTIVQLAQKTQDRFASNILQLDTFINENKDFIARVGGHKQKIEGIVSSYETLQQSLRSSRLLYGFTFREVAESKQLMKQRLSEGFGELLDARIQNYSNKYSAILPFTDRLKGKKENLMLQFADEYEKRFDLAAGKFLEESATTLLDTSVNAIRTNYYTKDDTIACDVLQVLSDQEIKLLDSLEGQINALGSGVTITSGTQDAITIQRKERKEKYLSDLSAFYKQASTSLLQEFENYVDSELKLYLKLVGYEIESLGILNQYNEQYRGTEDPTAKETLKNETIIPLALNLAKQTIHTQTFARCKKILSAMGYTASIQNDFTLEDAPESPKKNTTVSSSQPQDTNIQKAVQSYIQALETKYPEEEQRKAAITTMLEDITKSLTEDTLSADQKSVYIGLYKALQERL